MLSKQKIKAIVALQQKKFRNQEGLFVAEGFKVVQSIFQSPILIREVFYTADFPADDVVRFKQKGIACELITEREMERISGFVTPSNVLAVCAIPAQKTYNEIETITMVLDGIRDPGNLGTLIRLAAWYGIENIICSEDTAEFTNPKCVQATMGAISVVNVIYEQLSGFLKRFDRPIYGASLKGENIFRMSPVFPCFIVIGSESHGLSCEVQKLCAQLVSIPFHGKSSSAAESLNAAMAASIICSEFIRKIYHV